MVARRPLKVVRCMAPMMPSTASDADDRDALGDLDRTDVAAAQAGFVRDRADQGDCHGDAVVGVDELVRGVRIALGERGLGVSRCGSTATPR